MKIKFHLVIILFCSLIPLTTTAQNLTVAQSDSILSVVDTIESPFEKIKKLTSLAGKNRYTNSTRALITKALTIAKKNNDPLLLAHAHYSMGNYFFYTSKTDSSLTHLNAAQIFASKSNDPLILPRILTTKAGVYNKLGALILSISTNIESKQLLDKIDTLQLSKEENFSLKGQQLVVNNSLANLYSKTEDYTKALRYYDKAYKSALTLGSKANASIILGNKGDLLIKINKLEEALQVLNSSKKMKLEARLPKRFIGTSHLNLGMTYTKLNEYNNALKHYDTAYTLFIENHSEDGLMRVSTERGTLYNVMNRPELAILDCKKGKKMAMDNNDAEYTYKSCNCLYKAHKSLGNAAKALVNHELYSKVKDSLFNEKNIRKITQTGMQYEFDKIEAQQQLQIEKEKQKKNAILLGLIGAGLLLIGLFIFFKKRIKYQKTIAAQNAALQQQKITDLQQKNKLTTLSGIIEGQEAERLRIAKDLHDGLGGLLSTIKAHFTGIQNKCDEVQRIPLTKKTNELIDEACLEVRRVSHNMMPHSLSLSGLEGAFEDLGEQLKQQGYNVRLEVNNLPEKMDETKKIMIYRIAQEILSNIRKHANAASILIQLLGHKNQLILMIEDDGKGFNYNQALLKDGMGIKNINSRVAFLDGTIDWNTQLNNGTSITINIPV